MNFHFFVVVFVCVIYVVYYFIFFSFRGCILFFVAFLLLFNKSFKSVNDCILNNDFLGKNCQLKRTS